MNKLALESTLLLVFTIIVYAPCLKNGFIWDDNDYVTENLTLRSFEGLKHIWITPGAVPQYYPLVFTSFWIEYHIWGLQAGYYHLVNILLHGIKAVLLLLVLKAIGLNEAAWVAAAMFAVHPVHVESVAWITERKNVLSGFFYMAALYMYLKSVGIRCAGELSRQDGKRDSCPETSELRFYLLAGILFIFALLSKSVTLTLPFTFGLALFYRNGKITRKQIILLLPFLLTGALSGAITLWMEKVHVGAYGSEWSFTLVERVLIAGRIFWFYLYKLILPFNLTFIYTRWTIDATSFWQYIPPAGAVMLLLLLILLRKKSGWAPFSAMFYFLITLAPASGFFNVYPMRYSFVADHFQYLASIGPIILIAATFEKVLLGFRVLRIILYVLFLLLLAAGTWHHEQIFKDSETLWRDTVRKNPGAYIAHNNLGKILASKGLINEAIIHYMEALKLNPDHAEAHNNLGTALARLNRFDQAMSHFNKALELNPEYSDAHANLGKLLDLLGRTDEALDQYKKALEINPASFITHNNIANLLIRSGQPEKAKFHLLEALKINPDYTPARINLGLLGTRQ